MTHRLKRNNERLNRGRFIRGAIVKAKSLLRFTVECLFLHTACFRVSHPRCRYSPLLSYEPPSQKVNRAESSRIDAMRDFYRYSERIFLGYGRLRFRRACKLSGKSVNAPRNVPHRRRFLCRNVIVSLKAVKSRRHCRHCR